MRETAKASDETDGRPLITAPQISPVISRITGVHQSTVEAVVRRLGEAGRVPRGSRGRAAPEILEGDVAQILIGLMSVSDGLGSTIARVTAAVEDFAALGCTGRVIAAKDDLPDELDRPFTITPGGTFVEQLTYLITVCQNSDAADHAMFFISSIGVTVHREGYFAWLELTGHGELLERTAPKFTGFERRAIFGNCPRGGAIGIIREVSLNTPSLVELAEVLASGLLSSRNEANFGQ